MGTKPARLALLVGSPKAGRSTSASLGEYVLSRAGGEGATRQTHNVGEALGSDRAWDDMVRTLDEADVLILSFPLYWDGLPSHLVRGCERLRERGLEDASRKLLYVIVQNGFPEPWHNEVAVRICRVFGRQVGLRWMGALSIGGGAVVGGRPLERKGRLTIRLRETLDMASEAITRGTPIPAGVLKRLERPLYPPWFALLFGGIGWRRLARRRGASAPLRSRPFEKDGGCGK